MEFELSDDAPAGRVSVFFQGLDVEERAQAREKLSVLFQACTGVELRFPEDDEALGEDEYVERLDDQVVDAGIEHIMHIDREYFEVLMRVSPEELARRYWN